MTSDRFWLRVVSISKILLLCVVAGYGPTSGRCAALADDAMEPAGPSLTAPGVAEPAVAEPVMLEPSLADPAEVEPASVEPKAVEPAVVDPNKPEDSSQADRPRPEAKPETTKKDAQQTENPAAATGDEKPAADAAETPKSVGEPLAAGMIRLLQQEITSGLARRGIQGDFARFCSYAAGKLNSTARSSGSELTGNCRLRWYDHMLRNPVSAPAESEAFTRQLHVAVLDRQQPLALTLAIAAEKLDLGAREVPAAVAVASPRDALETIKQSLADAQLAYLAALAPLTKGEIQTLQANLYPILTSQNNVGHTLQNRSTGRRLCDLMELKLDRNAMLRAAESLAPISNRSLLEQLGSISADDFGAANAAATAEGVTGETVARIDTPSGAILIGGPGQNTYQLDKMPGVSVVIDLGGNDTYLEGSVSPQRPVLVVIDLEGNDVYRGSKPGIQGGAILGVSMLLDLAGDDAYQAVDVAQGSSTAGVGILIDYAGNDTYNGLRRVQGQALGGVGILIDRDGNDSYHAALWAQGMGGPLGFGMLDDVDGKDHYYGGGMYLNSYLDDENPTPGYEGWAQGVGGGLRQVSNGGIGVILDGGGDDLYEYDYLSHGGGYWCGLGFARDFGGNDQRMATRVAYNGGPRTQRSFVRFANGFACHYALGFCFDDQGNDTYNSTIMGVGFSWDCSVGYLCDFGGNDAYNGNEGMAAQAGLGVLFDYQGDDNYIGSRQGTSSSSISYHDMPMCGGNFSFVVDHGGSDTYGSRASNNTDISRGTSRGFLIDRPKEGEATKTAAKTTAKPAARTAAKPAAKATAGN